MLRQSAAAAIWLLLYLCPISQSAAQGVSRQCYEVKNETVCYFRPADGVMMNWDDADKFCRDNNATLPVIPNSDHQRTIETYLTQQKQTNVFVFTAGRKSWSRDPNYPWRWVNGKQSRTPIVVLFEDQMFGCIDRDTNMIPNGVISCPSFPDSFICQYPESNCKTFTDAPYQLHDRDRCFVIYDEVLSWYYARNKCIEGGGDLAIFEDVDTFMAFHSFTSAMKNNEYFIGLQRKWWTWRATDFFDVRYTNWPQRGRHDYKSEDISGLDCLCLDKSNSFKWASCNCSEGRSVLCQTANRVKVPDEKLKERTNSNPQTDKFSDSSRCFDLNGTQVCYFTPKNVTRLNFASASQWCRDHNATLPIIRNKIYQKSLEGFLETISQPLYLLWTSGLKVKTGVRSWINGQPFQESDMGDLPQFVSIDFRPRSPETLEQKGRLFRSFSYDKKLKPNNTGYVCQFPGDYCNNGIRSKNGECLVVNEEQVSWYEARLRCIDDGGDLATFEDVTDIEKLAYLLTSNKYYHIGLENSRWIWYQSDDFEDSAQYTNLNKRFSEFLEFEDHFDFFCRLPRLRRFQCARELENYFFCLCLETFTYKWTPCDCDLTFRFVCQRVESNSGSESSFQLKKTDPQYEMFGNENYQGSQGLIIAGVEGLIIAVLIIVVVSLVIRIKKKSNTVMNSELEMQVKTDDGYISVNPTIDSNPSEYQDLRLYENVR